MLIDLHAHTSGISHCCRIAYPEVLEEAKNAGLDGIVLTNHYTRQYLKDRTAEAFVEDYIQEYERTKAHGERVGCRVFFGLEVTMEWATNVHMLIYGMEPESLRKTPFLFDLPLEELYRTVKEAGGALVQAHPFRNESTVMNTDYLDGVEINCHPLYGSTYSEELLAIAKEAGITVTCGGDYHADTYRPRCGMYLPEELQTSRDVAEYLLTAEEVKLHVQQINVPIPEEITFLRK